MMQFVYRSAFICGLSWFGLVTDRLPAADELASSSWQIPTHAEVQSEIQNWIASGQVQPLVAEQIEKAWSEPIDPALRLSHLADCFGLLGGETAELMEATQASRFATTLPRIEFLDGPTVSDFLRDNARLIYARWLIQNQLYNETLDQLSSLQTDDVIDPASLLFFQGIANYRLLNKEACIPLMDRLLEQKEELPRRFAIIAKMVRDDIQPLKEDSLDEISRLMDSVRVRLGHGRAGKRVRTEEDEVIAKLDKMIKKLEEQAQQQQQASSSQDGQPGDNLNPAQPMNDSMPAGGRGPGNVDAKDIGDQQGWGNLPPKERQQALQQVGKDFPSHYRDVIEEYFRKLAKEGTETP